MNFKVRRVNIWVSWRMIVKGFGGYQAVSGFFKDNGEPPIGAIYQDQTNTYNNSDHGDGYKV